ncbi:MAG: putative hydro-lyase [Phycisphaerae bacterium]
MNAGIHARLRGRELRSLCRTGEFDGPTAGAAIAYAQANFVAVPADLAAHFEEFCRLNPRPCPLLETLQPGHYEPRLLAANADLRTDLPRYRVFRDGVCVDTPKEILDVWTHDLTAFLIGCSFTFESALLEAGLPVRHLEESRNVPMYRTDIPCTPAGPFSAMLVVSMRPMTPEQADRAVKVTSRYERIHGSPVRVGDPEGIGINDIHQPDYGEAVTMHTGEIPVFWACGVTPLEAIMSAKPPLAITHDPGHMFVTDLLHVEFRE